MFGLRWNSGRRRCPTGWLSVLIPLLGVRVVLPGTTGWREPARGRAERGLAGTSRMPHPCPRLCRPPSDRSSGSFPRARTRQKAGWRMPACFVSLKGLQLRQEAADPAQHFRRIDVERIADASAVVVGHVGVDRQDGVGTRQQVRPARVTKAGATRTAPRIQPRT